MTSRKDRRDRLKRVLTDLDVLRNEWKSQEPRDLHNDSSHARRERFKLLEAETAVLRLLQAESRLLQQVVLALGGFASGSLVTLLVKRLLE